MSKIKFFNEDCFNTMKTMNKYNFKVDIVLTSPPYNTGRPFTSEKSRNNNEGRYDVHLDTMTQNQYCQWCVNLFNSFDTILNNNGTILWNVSYGSDATVNTESIGLMWLSIADIIKNSNFTVADRIIWKKNSALPNNVSSNKLTRIVEDIFVFCRKDEYKTFNANKEISSVGKNGQTFYKNYYNFIEAKNNDGSCNLNKATFSTDLVKQLLTIYAKPDSKIYDPFMGTGTTAIGCEELGFDCYGSEISKNQVDFSVNRLDKFRNNN
jgi:site-specific DNA-methyltransferase (adenine-specific)